MKETQKKVEVNEEILNIFLFFGLKVLPFVPSGFSPLFQIGEEKQTVIALMRKALALENTENVSVYFRIYHVLHMDHTVKKSQGEREKIITIFVG